MSSTTTNEPLPRSCRAITAEVHHEAHCALAESPVWHDGVLYWCDVTGKTIFRKPDDSPTPTVHKLPWEIGSFVLWKKDHLVMATECGFHSYDLDSRHHEPWDSPEAGLENNRFNDGKCDPRGRFVAGTLNRLSKPEAALYSLDTNHIARRLFAPFTCSNGLAWSADGSVLYHIDTATNFVRAFDYDLESGELSASRIAVTIPHGHGKLDGMTIDREGNLWVALWGGWGLECWNPATGEQLARIDLPVARVTSCVFGGDHYDTLFITTARSGLHEAALATQPLAGSIFRAQPNARGWPAMHFKG